MRVVPFIILLVVVGHRFFDVPKPSKPKLVREAQQQRSIRKRVLTPTKTIEAPTPAPNPLREFVHQWKGTPYRWGGTSKRGIDCSGFVQRLYHDVYGENIPRVTRQQIREGQPVKRFRAGDLIFFTHRDGTPHHVVIHLGGGKIAHSVRGKGVIVEGTKILKRYRLQGRRL